MLDTQIEQVSHQGFEFLEQPHVAAALGGQNVFLLIDINLDGPASRLAHDVSGVDSSCFSQSAQVGMI
ncbi:hypothetical protein D3C76_1701110 [compost metagenome]